MGSQDELRLPLRETARQWLRNFRPTGTLCEKNSAQNS